MTQKHINDDEYHIDDPKYIDPSYNIKYFNKLLQDKHVTNYIPDELINYAQQYSNDLNVNKNYKNDLYLSTGLLKYLDSYKSHQISNNVYNERKIDVNNYYIMKYQSESHILKLIIFFCGLALIGSFFFLKGFIGESLYILYLGIILSIGIIIIIYNIYILIYRDNRHFDEHDFGYMKHPGNDYEGDNEAKLEINDKKDDLKCD